MTLVVPTSIPIITFDPEETPTPSPIPSICAGQLLEPSEDLLSCFAWAAAYNVSSGTLEHITGSLSCLFDTPICVPLACEIDYFFGYFTCEELVAQYSNDDIAVSVTQFLAWNPHLQGDCNQVVHAQRAPPPRVGIGNPLG
ncbi:hypothetical protein BDV12DRAFT_203762 [Aspergillus spectabilis]